jgi:hypothetical protein
MVGTGREDMRLRCPVRDESFRREDIPWEDAETGQFTCPICGGLHDEPADPRTPPVLPPPEVGTTGVRLFSLRSITFATMMGSTIAGGILLSVNYRRMQRPRAAWYTLIGITLFTLFILVPSAPLAGEVEVILVPLGMLIAMVFLANRLQGTALRWHRAAGGLFVHGNWAFLIVLGVSALFLGLAIGGGLLADWGQSGTWLELNQADAIQCTGDATEEDARRLAGVLEAEEIFGTKAGVDVFLEIDGTSVFVGFTYEAGDEDDPDLQVYLRWLGGRIATVFPSQTVSVRVYDQDGELRRTFPAD